MTAQFKKQKRRMTWPILRKLMHLKGRVMKRSMKTLENTLSVLQEKRSKQSH